MKRDDSVDRLLCSLEPPAPPPDLEGRTIMWAVRALAEPAEVDWWRRAWESSHLRLAWATAVLVLLVGHLAVTVRTKVLRPAVSWAEARAEQREAVGELPRISPGAITWEPAAGALGRTGGSVGTTAPEKETRQ
jgi:hypothetical protein